MSYCPQCGAEIPAEAVFCIQCGAASDASQVNAPTAHMRASEISRVGTPPPRSGASAATATSQADALLETVRAATLGEYEVMTELGRGGMAAVFLAHEIALDRKVALKVVLPALEQISPGIAERFLREARTSAGLSHPHVIPVYAVKQTPDLVYFVMKYVPGRTLESVIQDLGSIPVPIIRTILHQVGSALDYAHRNGVIHRDIKPANIILDNEGWAVVTDFGIAKVAEAEALTMTGATVGTPQYMSPEQCGGLDVTGASDQYSLGIMAYEMITGKPPFGDKSPITVMYEHCHTPVPPIADKIADCPAELVAAVMRMLEKEPADRWPTIEDAVAAFGAATDSEQQMVRTQILELAKRDSTNALLEKFHTPSSPAPWSRSAPRRASSKSTQADRKRSRLLLVGIPVTLILLAGAVGLGLALGGSDTPADEQPVPPAPGPSPAAVAPLTALDLAPAPPSVEVGQVVQLAAGGRDSMGQTVATPDLAWSVDDPAVASISPSGQLAALARGVVRVTARSDGQSATVTLRVVAASPRAPRPATPQSIATIAVQPPTATMRVGESVTLRAVLRDATGTALTDRTISWTSDAPGIAPVTAAGVVTGVAAGSARISVSSEGQRVTIGIEVTAVPITDVAVTPDRQTLDVGAVTGLTVVLQDANGRAVTGRPIAWTSSNRNVATVSSAGRVTAVAPGTTNIRATADGVTGTATITVTAPPPVVAAPPNARVASERILRAYGQALESRDVSRVRQAYPGLTANQARAWERFFGTVNELEVTHEVLDVRTRDDSTATVRVRATHMYRAARTEDRTFEFTATLRLVGGRWQLAAIE